MAMFPTSVENWRKYLIAAAPDIPTDFLLRWIEKESAGNMCSWTSYSEAGIFQLMAAQPGDAPSSSNDIKVGGTTLEALRAACVPNTQTFARNPTLDEKNEQVSSGLRYIRAKMALTRQRLAAVGSSWSENSPDFWMMVKLAHTLPSLMAGLVTAAKQLGRGPANWNEFVEYGAGNMYGASKWLPFAADIGSYGAGGPPGYVASASAMLGSLSGAEIALAILGIAAGGLGAFFFNRWHGGDHSV